MKITKEEKVRIGAEFLAALIAHPTFITISEANVDQVAAHAWAYVEAYCALVEAKTN